MSKWKMVSGGKEEESVTPREAITRVVFIGGEREFPLENNSVKWNP